MVFGLIGKVIDWNRGLNSVLPTTFVESRGRVYALRLERMGVKEEDIKKHMKKAEEQGSIKKVMKEINHLVKIQEKEGKLIFKIEQKEDVVEYDVAKHISDTLKSLKSHKTGEEYLKRVQILREMFEGLAKLQLGKVSYLMEGGEPWEGLANIAEWDMGTTEQVVLGEAVKQRRMIKKFERNIDKVKDKSDMIAGLKEEKKIEKAKKVLEAALGNAESVGKDLEHSIKLQFYCTLRLADFLEKEFKEDENIVDHYKAEGFPEKKVDNMKQHFELDIKRVNKKLEKEQGRLMMIINKYERAA